MCAFSNRTFLNLFGEVCMNGSSLVQYVNDMGVLSDRMNIIHAVWVDDHDLELIANSNASIAHNPNSNLRLGSGIMPFRKALDLNINVDWPLQHYKTAVRYLSKKPSDIPATGGTNWQKYLPPNCAPMPSLREIARRLKTIIFVIRLMDQIKQHLRDFTRSRENRKTREKIRNITPLCIPQLGSTRY